MKAWVRPVRRVAPRHTTRVTVYAVWLRPIMLPSSSERMATRMPPPTGRTPSTRSAPAALRAATVSRMSGGIVEGRLRTQYVRE